MNKSRLDRALERFEKDVNVGFAGPIPNSLLARQNLESVIVVLSDRGTPFRDKVSRRKGEGLAHLWNQRTSLDTVAQGPAGLVNIFYADGQLPPEADPTYVQKTAKRFVDLIKSMWSSINFSLYRWNPQHSNLAFE